MKNRIKTFEAMLIASTLAVALSACGDDGAGPDDAGTRTDSGGGDDAGMTGDDAGTVDSGMRDGGGTLAFDFRDDDPSAYDRVDRMGMPAVSTALISSKNEYNDDDPADDVMTVGDPPLPMWAGEIVSNLTALHGALDDDLTGAGLTPCGEEGDASGCAFQEVAPGLPVANLVIPDTLTIDTSAGAGFPNGRRLPDPVMDVTLAVILLDLETHAPDTLATLPLNPPENDKAFQETFPYLAAAHE